MLSRDVSQQLLGGSGAIHVARFSWLFCHLIREDASAAGLALVVYLAIAVIALVPAIGLVAHKPLGRTWWLIAFLIDALITLALIL